MARAPILVLISGLALAACGPGATEAPVCSPGLPPASVVLAKPAFRPLQYYTRVNFQAVRGAGYDVWGDSKFDYGAALQYTLVPNSASIRDGAQYCASAAALRLSWPLDEAKRRMLAAFVTELAPGTNLGAADLQARIQAVLSREEKYRALVLQEPFTIEAGRVTHPNRGDFFVVAFDWPSARQ